VHRVQVGVELFVVILTTRYAESGVRETVRRGEVCRGMSGGQGERVGGEGGDSDSTGLSHGAAVGDLGQQGKMSSWELALTRRRMDCREVEGTCGGGRGHARKHALTENKKHGFKC